jgi:hypothetical protein
MFDPYTEEGVRQIDNLIAVLAVAALIVVLCTTCVCVI